MILLLEIEKKTLYISKVILTKKNREFCNLMLRKKK